MTVESWVGHELDSEDEPVGLTIHTGGNRIQLAMSAEVANAMGSFLVDESGIEPQFLEEAVERTSDQ